MKVRLALGFSAIADVIVVIGILVSTKLVAEWWGEVAFAEYSIVRRVLAVLVPVAVLGFDIGIPRMLALQDSRIVQSEIGYGLLLKALGTALVWSSFISLVLIVDPALTAHIFFGDAQYAEFVYPLCALIVAYSVYLCCYAFLRGKLRFFRAAIIHAIGHGLVPIIVFWFFRDSLATDLYLVSAGILLVTLLALGVIYSARPRAAPRDAQAMSFTGLIRYSVGRVPAALALLSLTVIPSVVLAHLGYFLEGGFAAFGIMAVGVVATAVGPLGTVLLPMASKFIGQGRQVELNRQAKRFAILSVSLAVFSTLCVLALAPQISVFFLGDVNVGFVLILRLSILASIPFCYFSCMRHIVDAHFERPVNTYNVFAGLLMMLVMMVTALTLFNAFFDPVNAVIGSYLAGVTVIALLTALSMRRVFMQAESAC